jgi:hypothetical protein
MNGYKSRKSLPGIKSTDHFNCSTWSNDYYNAANTINLLDKSIENNHVLTRQEAVNVIYAFKSTM